MHARHGPDAMAIALAALRRAGELTDPTLQNALARSILAVLSIDRAVTATTLRDVFSED